MNLWLESPAHFWIFLQKLFHPRQISVGPRTACRRLRVRPSSAFARSRCCSKAAEEVHYVFHHGTPRRCPFSDSQKPSHKTAASASSTGSTATKSIPRVTVTLVSAAFAPNNSSEAEKKNETKDFASLFSLQWRFAFHSAHFAAGYVTHFRARSTFHQRFGKRTKI